MTPEAVDTMTRSSRLIWKVCGLALAAAGLSGAAVAQQSPGPLPAAQVASAIASLDGVVTDLMQQSGVPGVAVAVVQDGETVFAKGYGVRELGQPDPVEPGTVFQIASLSKSLAATVVATQIGKNGVAWDTPVQTLMPSFALSDPWVGAHATVGDLFAHRSGLPDHAGDALEDLGYDRDYVLSHLDLLPLAPFRASYAYTNFGLTAAAEAVAVAAGTDWASLSETALFQPLGMADSSARFDDFVARPDRAIGHTITGGAFVPYWTRQPDAQSPAGGVSSTVVDFAKWMMMVLDDGKLAGAPYLSEAALFPAITPQVISRAPDSPEVLPDFYGFGIGVGQSRSGRMMLSHSGAFLLGASTRYEMLPEADLGIVVFTNAAPVGVAEAIARDFMDRAEFGAPQRDWYGLFTGIFQGFQEPVGSLAGQPRPTDPDPAAPLSTYAGDYANAYFGTARVVEGDGGLVLRLGPEGEFALTHWSGDIFIFTAQTENMPDGSLAAARFGDISIDAAGTLNIDYLDEHRLGTFNR